MDDTEFIKQTKRVKEYEDSKHEIQELCEMKDFIYRAEHSAIHITADAEDTKGEEIVLTLENADAVRKAISIALSDRIDELNKYLKQI